MSRQTAFPIATSPVVRSPSSASIVPAHGTGLRGSRTNCACWRRCAKRSGAGDVWVIGAVRWRNPPDIDLPADLDAHRTGHYERLGQPLDPSEFIAGLRGVPSTVLSDVDAAIATDDTGGLSTGI